VGRKKTAPFLLHRPKLLYSQLNEFGGAEFAGPENDGPQKNNDWKNASPGK